MKKYCKKTISYILIMCLLMQTCVVNFASVFAATTASATQQIMLGNTTIDVNQTLKENADGSYTYSLELSSELGREDKNVDQNVPQNDYFVAKESGTYLIELWGGDGASGSKTSYSDGGTGGSGGYVYGTIELEAGEVLYYTLGGDGVQTNYEDVGGGVNGSGGGHGDLGSYAVGGGGGYSAVFKFEEGDFDKYLDANGEMNVDSISEEDRISKYVMIAAGGGGGGAGNGFSFHDPVGTADGGAGGNMSSNNGTLSGDAYAVEGTFFEGEDGKSSGTSFEYIGHGGTNEPGAIADTILTIFKGKEPNDWAGTVNENYAGGGGGAGNFRGGAGGAGFCGGSGGLMTALTEATNVGGGGGGSSFIAKEVTYSGLSSDITSELKGTNSSETGGSDTGGMVKITFVDKVTDDARENLVFKTELSEYFDFVSVKGNEGISGACSDDGELTISNIDLGEKGAPVTVDITLKPKDGFAGGNGVPLFSGTTQTFEHKKTLLTDSDTIEINTESFADVSYVNVTLNLGIEAKSYMISADTTYVPTDFYVGAYTDAIDNGISNYWQYDFIQSMEYVVTDEAGTNITANVEVKVDNTDQFPLEYPVKLTVTLKDGKVATVGTVVSDTEYTDTAVISLITADSDDLNGESFKYNKTLEYDEATGKYVLSLNLTSGKSLPEGTTIYHDTETKTYTVPEDGYYMIQAWGANGGDGGDVNDTYTGGVGGAGGYVEGYKYLTKGTNITVVIGSNGTEGTHEINGGTQSTGGGYTTVKIKENYALVAGGGGGGGNAGIGSWGYDGKDGSDGNSNTNVEDTIINNIDDLTSLSSGTDGYVASYEKIFYGIFGYECQSGGAGGAAGVNCYDSDVISIDTEASSDTNLSSNAKTFITEATSSDYTNNGGGAVKITCIQASNDLYKNYSLVTKISEYFQYDESDYIVEFDEVNTTTTTPTIEYVIDTDNTNTKTLTISDINPMINEGGETDANDKLTNVTSSVNFTIKIPLQPIDGFLGGNDVPVITSMTLKQSNSELSIASNDKTDYANVPITYTPAFETYDKTYILGTAGIEPTELYSWLDKDTIVPDSNSLIDDYVNFEEKVVDEKGKTESGALTPSETTTYNVTVGLAPIDSAQKAVVRTANSTDGNTITKPATIYVNYQATYNLTNMTTSAVPTDVNGTSVYAIDPATDYVVTLSPENGYLLPDDIEVTKADDNTAINFTYDNETGELVIPKDQLTENIIITATGKVVKYKLIYAYETAPGSGQMLHIEEYAAGEPITSYFSDTYPPDDYDGDDGYEFVWDWATGVDNDPLTTMPANNHTVVGKYVANEYTLTINYIDENGNKLFDSHTEKVQYKRTYSVKSPEKAGYLPDQTTVSGTMPAMDYEINVTYTPTANKLNIIYVFDDTGEEHSRHTANYDTDATFKVTSPIIEGYTASQSEVSGTMTADGVTVYVYYTPNKYTVTFDDEGGNLSDAEKTRTVVYNNLYGYIYSKVDGVETLTYTQFPEPTKLGYTFGGWYTEANGQGSLVKEDTTVTITDGQTLYAHWIAKEYTVTVEYQYEDGTTALETHKETFAYGDSYSIASPKLTGYTPNQPTVSGKIGAQNVKVIVTYVANDYTLTIHYEYQDGSEAAADYDAKVKYGTQYSVTSPTIDGYTASSTVVTGTMPANDREITVIYYTDLPDISVTVTWGDLSFDYNRGQWDTDDLTYGADSITPVTDNGNTIAVTNNEESETYVEAEIAYESADKYSTLIGYFTPDDKSDSETQSEKVYTTEPIGVDSSATTYLWLKGTLDKDVEGTITSGTCSVTIRATTESEEGGN